MTRTHWFRAALLPLLAATASPASSRAAEEARPRYQIVFSPHGAADTFLIDTANGRVWQMVFDERSQATWFQERAVQKDDNPRFAEMKREIHRDSLRRKIQGSDFQERLRQALDLVADSKGWILAWDDDLTPAFRTPQGDRVERKDFEKLVEGETERLAREHAQAHRAWADLLKELRRLGSPPDPETPARGAPAEVRIEGAPRQ